MKLEGAFERDCIKLLKQIPHSYWPNKATLPSVAGTPDRIGCVNRIYCALEFKRSEADAKDNKLQSYVLHKIRKAGGYAEFVHPGNWEKVYNDIRRIAGV